MLSNSIDLHCDTMSDSRLDVRVSACRNLLRVQHHWAGGRLHRRRLHPERTHGHQPRRRPRVGSLRLGTQQRECVGSLRLGTAEGVRR